MRSEVKLMMKQSVMWYH